MHMVTAWLEKDHIIFYGGGSFEDNMRSLLNRRGGYVYVDGNPLVKGTLLRYHIDGIYVVIDMEME